MEIAFNPGFMRDTNDFTNIVFSANVDGKTIYILVESEALQDIVPDNLFDPPELQFQANRYYFEAAAEELIQAGEIHSGWVKIKGHHVR